MTTDEEKMAYVLDKVVAALVNASSFDLYENADGLTKLTIQK